MAGGGGGAERAVSVPYQTTAKFESGSSFREIRQLLENLLILGADPPDLFDTMYLLISHTSPTVLGCEDKPQTRAGGVAGGGGGAERAARVARLEESSVLTTYWSESTLSSRSF